MSKTKSKLSFWLGLWMFGEATKSFGYNRKELFEHYEYNTPFALPKLNHQVFGNTFLHNNSNKTNNTKAERMAENISERIEEMEGIELIPVYSKEGANAITLKFKPYNNIKKAYSLKRQLKYLTKNEETRIYEEGDKIVVEVPNKGKMVLFGDFMHDTEYRISDSKTIIPIGKNVNGENIYGDLAKMPHMLVAGTTGSGKSVFLNGLIVSLLMKNTPYDLNLVLIDPKMVEFKRFSSLKYVKYITSTDEAVDSLSTLCYEMDKRYELMAQNGCRNIDEYNKKYPNKRLPKIVLVIDEMADMMENKQYSKKVESNIVRLAQKARASGIHMVLATQRPTVKVISGQIKANIPCRVCLSLMTKTDSMVVLDQIGAENLQGHGDLLYLDGMNNRKPQRLQAGNITDAEICNVVVPLALDNQPTTLNEINWDAFDKDVEEYYRR